MYAVLLNPPRRRRRRRRNKLSRACRRHIAKRAGARRRKGRKKRTKASYRKAARKAARTRRRRKSAAAAAKRADPFGALPAAYAKNPRRRRRRKRRRNYSHWIPAYKNPRRRKRARYNYGRRHRRRKRRRNYSHWIPAYKNPSWIPSYAMNPGAQGIVKTITKGFDPKVIKKAGPVVAGALLNTTAGRWASSQLPGVFQEGIPNIAVNLGTAGLIGFGAGMINRRWAGPVFFGGVVEAVTRVATEYILPAIGLQGCMGCGLGDYAEAMKTSKFVPSFSQATKLNSPLPTAYAQSPVPPSLTGIGDYLTPMNAATARPLGDYLTVANASAARPLGGFEGVEASELM